MSESPKQYGQTESDPERHSIESMARRLRQRENKKYVIDKIFPTNAMHIISGESSSGKSTWLFQILYEWANGRDVLGFRSFPCPWVMITYDRGLGDTDDTLVRLGMGDWRIPIYAFEDLYCKGTEPDLISICNGPKFKGIELFIIEGLTSFIPDPKPKQSQNKAEQMWIARIRSEILAKGKTIIGTMHKAKAQGGGQRSRNDMLGSASFVGGLSTVVLFDETSDVKKARANGKIVKNEGRMVTVCPRQIKDFSIQYERDANGKFVEFDDNVRDFVEDPDEEEKRLTHVSNINKTGARAGEPDALKKMDSFLASFKPGDEVKTKDLLVKGYEVGWSVPTTNRWISDQVEKGKLTRLRQGTYGKGAGVN